MKIDEKGRFVKVEKDIIGVKKNFLLIQKRFRQRKGLEISERWYLECLCDCGKQCVILERNVLDNIKKSCGCANKKPFGIVSQNTQLCNYRRGAKNRGFTFELTKEQFIEITSKKCHYCNADPVEKVFAPKSVGYVVVNGVDRKDSKIGYTMKNCVPCCTTCNFAKSNKSYEEFLSFINKIYNNLIMGKNEK